MDAVTKNPVSHAAQATPRNGRTTMRHVATLIVLLFVPPATRADVRATLPLGGHYRPGMCMPVRVEGTTPPDTMSVELTADGAVPTRLVLSGGQINAVLPFLAAREIDGLRVNGVKVDASLHTLPNGARLIGTAVTATRFSTASSESIIVPLDPLDPVPGPAMAWEAMDELIVDAAGAARLGGDQLLALLALGVDIMVPGDARPTVDMPWEREGDGWVLRYEPLGPRGSVFAPAMLPVAGSQPGLPERVRRQALLAAALFAILATAVAMWRSRRMVLSATALVAATVVAIGAWQSRQPKIRLMQGTITIQKGAFTQRDAWRYAFASEPQKPKLLIGARVVADSPEALLEQTSLLQPSILRSRWVALLSRTLSTDTRVATVDAAALISPLTPLAKAGYERPNVTVVGQIPDGPWPTVVLRATEP
jgi:hypothetical protein